MKAVEFSDERTTVLNNLSELLVVLDACGISARYSPAVQTKAAREAICFRAVAALAMCKTPGWADMSLVLTDKGVVEITASIAEHGIGAARPMVDALSLPPEKSREFRGLMARAETLETLLSNFSAS